MGEVKGPTQGERWPLGGIYGGMVVRAFGAVVLHGSWVTTKGKVRVTMGYQ